MIRRILKAIPTVLRSLRRPGRKSAPTPLTGQPVTTKVDDPKSASSVDRDSHMLAEIYLRERGNDKGRLTLRFYQGQYWRWPGFCSHARRNPQLRAEVTRSVKKYFDEQADKNNKPALRVTTSLIT